jgi:hypothetical protein
MLASGGYQYANRHFTRPNGYDKQWAEHFRRIAKKQEFPPIENHTSTAHWTS